MKKFITTFAAVVIAASVTASAAAATAFHSNYSGTQDIKKGTETVYSIDASYKPEVATGNAKVATTKFWYQSGNRYFYKLNATGDIGASTGVYAGTKTSKSQIFVAKVASPTQAVAPTAPSSIKCSLSGLVDLNTSVASYYGGSLYFTVDAPAGFTVTTGNSAVGTVDKDGSDASGHTFGYHPVTSNGASTGVYVNGVQVFVVKNYSAPSAYNKSQDEFADELLTLINNERSNQNETSLSKADYLMKAAVVRAQELSVSYEHSRPTGTTVDLINSFSDHKIYGYSEIIAQAGGDVNGAKDAFYLWMNSEGHRGEIQNAYSVNYGAAYYTTPNGTRYFIALFTDN